MSRSKNVKMSESQKELLLEFMFEHREFAANRLLGPLGRQKSKQMWEELAEILNAVGVGATKDTSKWKTSWSDWKIKTKSKASSIAVYARGTGGGEAPMVKLTAIEQKLLTLLGSEIVNGDLAIAEAGFPSADSLEEVHVYKDNSEELLDVLVFEEDEQINESGNNIMIYNFEMELEQQPCSSTTKRQCTDMSAPNAGAYPPCGAAIETIPEQKMKGLGSSTCKRKKLNNSGTDTSKNTKKVCPDNTAYDRAAANFTKIEEDKLKILQIMHDVLVEINTVGKKKADAAVRRAVASERKATALERIATAKEKKYSTTNK